MFTFDYAWLLTAIAVFDGGRAALAFLLVQSSPKRLAARIAAAVALAENTKALVAVRELRGNKERGPLRVPVALARLTAWPATSPKSGTTWPSPGHLASIRDAEPPPITPWRQHDHH